MCRLRCKGEEEEGRHKDGRRINPRGGAVVNRVKGVEEVVATIDPYLTSILKGGGLSEDAGEGSAAGPTRFCSTPVRS